MLVCGDVIEHLVRPERLLHGLRLALDHGAHAVFLTTPDRELISGVGHLGPPENPAHVREWRSSELAEFMASVGLRGHFGLTRSNDVMPYMRTILVVIPGRASVTAAAVAQWWGQRVKWERLAVEQDRLIASQAEWIKELDAARTWFREQSERWQRRAEASPRRAILSRIKDVASIAKTRRRSPPAP